MGKLHEVARALGECPIGDVDIDHLSNCLTEEHLIILARAAVEELREPTPDQKLLMARSIGETAGIRNHIERADKAWSAGIDAILAEDTNGHR